MIMHRRLQTWLPVGGELESGETPLEAAMRELGDPWGQTEMQSAADTLERLLGPQHPHVLATRSWLK